MISKTFIAYIYAVLGDSLWLSSTIPGFVYWRNENSGSRVRPTYKPGAKIWIPSRPVSPSEMSWKPFDPVPLDQIPSIGLSTIGKLVGFLPTSNGLKYKNPAN